MAQTTGATATSKFEVGVSTDGASWTDISGEAATVAVTDGDQLVGEQFTATGYSPIVVGSAKRGARTITVSCVYSEGASEAFEVIHARFQGTTPTLYVRWAPKGGIGTVAGNNIFTTADDAGSAVAAQIINCTPPDHDAGTGDVAMFEFSVRCADILEEVTATS